MFFHSPISSIPRNLSIHLPNILVSLSIPFIPHFPDFTSCLAITLRHLNTFMHAVTSIFPLATPFSFHLSHHLIAPLIHTPVSTLIHYTSNHNPPPCFSFPILPPSSRSHLSFSPASYPSHRLVPLSTPDSFMMCYAVLSKHCTLVAFLLTTLC